MTSTQAIRLVATREMREAVRRRSFWVIAAVLFVGSTAAMVVPSLLHHGPTTDDVALVGGSPSLEPTLVAAAAAARARIRVQPLPDADSARRAVDEGRADVAVVAGDPPLVVVKAGKHESLVRVMQQALAADAIRSRLEAAGLTPAAAAAAFEVTPARVEGIDASADSRRTVAALAAIVLYLLLLTLTIQAATGVAIEKANRISEVLLAIVKPGPLLFGKVIGVGVVGTLTLFAAVAPVLVKLLAGGNLPSGIGGALGGGAAWFVLGLALYLIVAGSLGALVERQEEAGSVVAPLTMTLIGSFFVAQSAPDSTLAAVLAYFPLSSPVVMPARIAIGASSPIEMALSLLIGAVAVVLAARTGAVVYQRAIVRTGKRLKVGEVLRRPA